jgi:predicted RNA binding protein YcfA (HicA-like mRNA interferase family)
MREAKGGKGSHRNFIHPKGVVLTISGKLGDDVKNYQEKEVFKKLRSLKNERTRPLFKNC